MRSRSFIQAAVLTLGFFAAPEDAAARETLVQGLGKFGHENNRREISPDRASCYMRGDAIKNFGDAFTNVSDHRVVLPVKFSVLETLRPEKNTLGTGDTLLIGMNGNPIIISGDSYTILDVALNPREPYDQAEAKKDAALKQMFGLTVEELGKIEKIVVTMCKRDIAAHPKAPDPAPAP